MEKTEVAESLFTEHRLFRKFISWGNSVISSFIPAQAALKNVNMESVDGLTAAFIVSFTFLQHAVIWLDDASAPVDSYKKEGFQDLMKTSYLASALFNSVEINIELGGLKMDSETVPIVIYLVMMSAIVQRFVLKLGIPVSCTHENKVMVIVLLLVHALFLTILVFPLMWSLGVKIWTGTNVSSGYFHVVMLGFVVALAAIQWIAEHLGNTFKDQ
jgi:hypothetical protein